MKHSLSLFLLLVSLTLSAILPVASSAKILAIVFFSSKSHKLTYMPLLEELAAKGHQIDIISPIKSTKKTPNINEIYTLDVEKLMGDWNVFEIKKNNQNMNPFLMLDVFGSVCEQSYDLPQVKEHFNKNPQYDLIFLQPLFNDCVLGLVHKMKAPLVLFFPTSVPQLIMSKIGGDLPSSFVPNLFMGFPQEMTFPQRFINFGMNLMIEGILRFYYEPYMTNIYREKLGDPSLPTVTQILANTSLVLSNGHFSMSGPKPYLPDVIDVGGIHSRPAKPLPKDLENFINKSGKDGFIFFSLGSAIKGSAMPEDRRKMFLKVFSQLKQTVLWKWETESMPDLPKNVKLSKWFPQQDLLGHPNIKMFITHCGGGGTEEAVYHGVPLLGLPFFGDQTMNARLARNNGYLVELDWNDLTEDQLRDAINEILNNPKYTESVKKVSKVFKDQPDDPLQRGVFWIEYVLRHKGAPHLRSAARKLNFFQYHSYDVIATYLAIISTIMYIFFAILRFIVRKVWKVCCPGSSDSKNKKKNATKIKLDKSKKSQ